jgi:hypothetical protein
MFQYLDALLVAVRTGTQIERLRQMFEIVGVQAVPGAHGLWNPLDL